MIDSDSEIDFDLGMMMMMMKLQQQQPIQSDPFDDFVGCYCVNVTDDDFDG
jgi:hypothetical protein